MQVKALQHALTLPKLQRLVYSTCSIHEQENELVVKAVLDQAKELGFELVDPFPSWKRRGLPSLPGHEKLIRIGEPSLVMLSLYAFCFLVITSNFGVPQCLPGLSMLSAAETRLFSRQQ